ncbi:MAG: MFS transporter [Hyphomicrobiales bacterium]|nr:MFS transporter [Hyphomicrobiales bacterium]
MQSRYRWIIVAAGGFLGCVAAGTMFSLAVFLQPIAEDTGWSRAAISSAMTINFLCMGAAAFGWGHLTDKVGARPVLICGALLLGTGVVLASRATSLVEFQIVYGVFVGVATGAVFAPVMATVTGWFETQRSLAVSLVSAGMGMAPVTVSPFARWLVSAYDWRTAQLVIGLFAWALMIPAALLVRRPPTLASASSAASARSDMSLRDALRTPQFVVIALTYFCCCATHSGPIFHTVSYALTCGVPAMAAVTIYSVEGLAGLGGRLIFGIAGDRFGAKRALVVGLMIQATAAGAYFFVGRLPEFYAVAIVFGAAYGGVMPLYAVLIRENFSLRIMGGVTGAAVMISALGMAMGPLAGGWIYDSFASYGWLYIGSFGIGWGAVAIALLFRPARKVPALAPA